MKILLISLGGAVGTLLRYGHAIHLPATQGFPPTLWINLSGSLVLGALTGASLSRGWFESHWYPALTIGVLGGFTTFSTFSVESVLLLTEKGLRTGMIYVLLSTLGSIVLAGIGFAAAQAISMPSP